MKIGRHCFPNGLRLVHHESTNTQVAALNIVYDVGACDKHPEYAGFAYLFECLMFSSSAHTPDCDIPLQLARRGNDAWTSNGITNHYLTVPKTNMETAFWLESDRMLELTFNERGLEVQRGVVMEEFKQRCLNQPYGGTGHLFRPLASRVYPYRWSTIGKELPHIKQAMLDKVKSFFYRFYAPNSIVLAATGNISQEETVRLTEKWFGPVPWRNVLVRRLPQEPEQAGERRLTVKRNVPLDALLISYHICDRGSADYHTFDILSDTLSNGRSSRLNRRLMREQSIFSGIDAYISGTRDTGLSQISGRPAVGVSLEQAEAAVYGELEELRQSPVGAQELGKAKNKFESTQIFGNINYLSMTTNLAWFKLTGKAENIDPGVERYCSVITEQLHTAAQRAFCENDTVVLYYKSDKWYVGGNFRYFAERETFRFSKRVVPSHDTKNSY